MRITRVETVMLDFGAEYSIHGSYIAEPENYDKNFYSEVWDEYNNQLQPKIRWKVQDTLGVSILKQKLVAPLVIKLKVEKEL